MQKAECRMQNGRQRLTPSAFTILRAAFTAPLLPSALMRALIAHSQNDVRLEDIDLPVEGEVLVDVACSSLNYKDALAVTGRGRIVRRFPLVLGIDLAGTVAESSTDDFRTGDRVVG